MSIFLQLAMNDWNWKCIDVADVALSAAQGAIGMGMLKNAVKVKDMWDKSKKASQIIKSVANAAKQNAGRKKALENAYQDIRDAAKVAAGIQVAKNIVDAPPLVEPGPGDKPCK